MENFFHSVFFNGIVYLTKEKIKEEAKKMNELKRLKAVIDKMKEENVDAFYLVNEKNIRYLTGFTGDESYLLILGEKAIFLTDSRFTEQAKTQIPKEIEIVLWQGHPLDDAIDRLNDFEARRIFFEGYQMNYIDGNDFVNSVDGEVMDADKLVEKIRVIKDEEEIRLTKKACEITDATFQHILTFIKPGMTEREIAAEMEHFMKLLGADGTSFETIVASGIRSSFPHGTATDKKVETGDLITLDFGALYQGYAADMTRTIAIGEVDPRLEEAYYHVLTAQKNGLKGIKAGMTCGQVDALVRENLIAANLNQYFSHGTGHSIGLDIHEEPIIRGNSAAIIEENMIMTIEPGVYLPNLGGIRIEDDILVTKGEGIILNTSPKDTLIKL